MLRKDQRGGILDILITAGATRNPIDAMRYISAHSSGQTGVWLAERFKPSATVHLLGSPEALLRCRLDIPCIPYSSTRDLMHKMETWLLQHPAGVVVHAAAVGDYEATDGGTAGKIASGQSELTITLVPTPKIVDHIKAWAPNSTLISFKAAAPGTSPQKLLELATAQRERTGSLWVFANVIGALNENLLLLGPDGPEWCKSRPLAMSRLVAVTLR